VELIRKTETYEKRFGVTAVELGLITAEQLVDALRTQVNEDLKTGKHRLLGQILRESGLLTPDQVEEVLTRSLTPKSALFRAVPGLFYPARMGNALTDRPVVRHAGLA